VWSKPIDVTFLDTVFLTEDFIETFLPIERNNDEV
jgi:hypothetical protein